MRNTMIFLAALLFGAVSDAGAQAVPPDVQEEKIEATKEIADAERKVDDEKVEATEEFVEAESLDEEIAEEEEAAEEIAEAEEEVAEEEAEAEEEIEEAGE